MKLLNGGSFNFPLSSHQILLILLAFSFLGTAAEVTMMHYQDNFIPAYEWIPVIYPLFAAGTVMYYLIRPWDETGRYVFTVIMILGIVVGLLGFYFHVIGNSVHSKYLWNWFIKGAPVLGPLVISWLSLFGLALINASRQVLLRICALGFLLLAFTSYLDHAQTGFESYYTWAPVIGGIFGFCLVWLVTRHFHKQDIEKKEDIPTANLFYAVMLLMIITGISGFTLHVIADFHATTTIPWFRFFHYAPVMVPLLFAQIGLISVISSLSIETQTKEAD